MAWLGKLGSASEAMPAGSIRRNWLIELRQDLPGGLYMTAAAPGRTHMQTAHTHHPQAAMRAPHNPFSATLFLPRCRAPAHQGTLLCSVKNRRAFPPIKVALADQCVVVQRRHSHRAALGSWLQPQVQVP